MSPLAAPPLRGYQDGQRVDNWDIDTLYSDNNLTIGNLTVGPFDVSRFAYLAGFDLTNILMLHVTITWYMDPAALVVCGQRQFPLSNTLPRAYYRLPNLGPFVKINWATFGGPTSQHSSVIFATNRVHPLEFIPVNPVLINVQAGTLPAGNTPFSPSDYYSGPIQVWCQPSVGPVNVSLQALDFAANWDFINQFANLAAGNDITETWIAPPGAWRIQITNAGAAGTTFLAVTPSTTGAA